MVHVRRDSTMLYGVSRDGQPFPRAGQNGCQARWQNPRVGAAVGHRARPGRLPGGPTAFRIVVHPHHALPLDRGKSHKLLKKRRQKNFCNRSIFCLTRCFAWVRMRSGTGHGCFGVVLRTEHEADRLKAVTQTVVPAQRSIPIPLVFGTGVAVQSFVSAETRR